MAKFYGKVGYSITKEQVSDGIGTGVFVDEVIERFYYGDVQNRSGKWQSSGNLNDDKDVTQTISIVADAFAYQNFSRIKYVEWMGVKWKVTSIDPLNRPRLILGLGGEYNGQ